LVQRIRNACSTWLQDLERNGQNLQHFCRELSRYFRNLLVARIAGAETRLIAASDSERMRNRCERRGSSARKDLTRFLQLTLTLFTDLQTNLQAPAPYGIRAD